MTKPPLLDPAVSAPSIQPRYALLVNPFYPKDPNASFGKHVLTPTLALTSFAAVTPGHWEVRYWDENLLDGRPPFQPMPELAISATDLRRRFSRGEPVRYLLPSAVERYVRDHGLYGASAEPRRR